MTEEKATYSLEQIARIKMEVSLSLGLLVSREFMMIVDGNKVREALFCIRKNLKFLARHSTSVKFSSKDCREEYRVSCTLEYISMIHIAGDMASPGIFFPKIYSKFSCTTLAMQKSSIAISAGHLNTS